MNCKQLLALCALAFTLMTSGTANAQQDGDASARALGFLSFQHFQQSRSTCLDLLAKNPLLPEPINCGTDLACLQREGEALQRRFHDLTQSYNWKSSKCDIIVEIEKRSRHSSGAYQLQVSYKDEFFVINGEKFKAKTYCFNMEEGDDILFVEGSPFGSCVSATIVNLRTNGTCDVWCE